MKPIQKKLTHKQCIALFQAIQKLQSVPGGKCEVIMSMYFMQKIFERLRMAIMTKNPKYTLRLTAHEAAAFFVCFHDQELEEDNWGLVIACDLCMMIHQVLELNSDTPEPEPEPEKVSPIIIPDQRIILQ